jgi:hypothetical protein
MTLLAPQATLAPTSLSADLFTGETDDQIVTLANVGPDSTLDFYIPTPAIGEPMAAQAALTLGKDDPDPRSNDPVILGLGGPDAGGYRWIDSDEPGGPVFSWIDISATGTLVGPLGDDAISDPFALGFSFPLYGVYFDSVRVASNGFLSFTSSSSPYTNQPLPSSAAPENLIAPFWDDLNPTAGGDIYFEAFPGYVVVQFHNIETSTSRHSQAT